MTMRRFWIAYFISMLAFLIVGLVCAIIAMHQTAYHPEQPLDDFLGPLGGISLFIGMFHAPGLAFFEGEHMQKRAKPPKPAVLTRKDKRELERNYAERFNDPEYGEFLTWKVDRGA